MANYTISKAAREDLIRIHNYSIHLFGMIQADKYFNSFFECFDKIAERPFSFESGDYIRIDYRSCVCGSDNIYFRINESKVEIKVVLGRQYLKKLL